MTKKTIALALTLALLVSGCSSMSTHSGFSSGNPGSYCSEHTEMCVAGGIITAALIGGIIANSHGGSGGGGGCGPRGAHGLC